MIVWPFTETESTAKEASIRPVDSIASLSSFFSLHVPCLAPPINQCIAGPFARPTPTGRWAGFQGLRTSRVFIQSQTKSNCLVGAQHLDLEVQGGVGHDAPGREAARAVGVVRGGLQKEDRKRMGW